MQQNTLMTIAIAVLTLILGFAIGRNWDRAAQTVPTTEDFANITTSPQPGDPNDIDDPLAIPRSENITIEFPQPNAVVTSPLIVRGQARTFEQGVSGRLLQEDGTVLVENFTTATAPDAGMFGPYELTLQFSQPTTMSGIVEVYEISAQDGREINKVRIPVRFQQL
jgi:hypothetical protein